MALDGKRNISRPNRQPSKRRFKLFETGKMDITFFTLVVILLTIGLIMLFSASYVYAYTYYGNSYHFITRQAVFALAGLVIMYFVSRIDYHIYRKAAWPLYVLSVLLLIIVLILPPTVGDFHRWIVVGPINFQPSEIAKFAIVLLFAHLISKNYDQMKKFTFGILFLGILLLIVCGLVVVETHLSATLLIGMMGVVLMIVGGIKLKYVGIAAIAGIGLGILAIVTGIVDYGSDRITYWLHPEQDPMGLGFQTLQSLYAIGSGGFWGRGLGNSIQKFLWVPEPQNDFIFAIVCEEVGFIGALLIVILFVLLVWRGFVIAMRAPDKFGTLIAVGLTFQVGLQAALNILVVTNTIPNTGISLPFFSYGGTALLMLLAEMGVVLSISRKCNLEKR